MNMHSPASCASCAKADCHLSFVSRDIAPVMEKTAFVLDEVWPEYRRFVDGQVKAEDQVLSPGLFGARPVRYDWGRGRHPAGWATLQRHLAMLRVAKARGAVRQATYLKGDEVLAHTLARSIDYRAGHIVVAQAFLPFLWREGSLGGRTFDVLMSRYPLTELHQRLDAVHRAHPDSVTIGDFRAPEAIVQAEAEALAAARRIITPHHDLAELFSDRAVWLDWQRPTALPGAGTRVAFLGPVVARQGAHEARELARGLREPMVVFGTELERADIWEDVTIERRLMTPNWYRDIGVVLHPAAITNQPRRLLEAVSRGIRVYARASSGLPPGDYQPLSRFPDDPLTKSADGEHGFMRSP